MDPSTLEKLRAGDERAWEVFFQEFDPLVRSVVAWKKWGFAVHVQEELAQDIRSELTRTLARFRGESRLDYFIKRVCIHRCIDRVRRQVREREHFVSLTVHDDSGVHERDVPAGKGFDPVRQVVHVERARALHALLATLDATCQKAISLFYLDELSYKEIAVRLGITVNTVGSRLAKCLEKLRGRIGHEALLGEEAPGSARQYGQENT